MGKRKGLRGKQIALLLSSFLILSCSKKETSSPGARWSAPDGSISVSLPEDWEFEDQNQRPVPGFFLIKGAPSDDPLSQTWSEPAAMIRFAFYRPGGPFESPADFAKKKAPAYSLKKETLNKTPVQSLEYSFQEPFPPKSVSPKLYDSRNKTLFLEKENGFWALEYTAISLRYPQYLPVFERITREFAQSVN